MADRKLESVSKPLEGHVYEGEVHEPFVHEHVVGPADRQGAIAMPPRVGTLVLPFLGGEASDLAVDE